MGKLLFVNTNRTNGIVGLVASLVFAGLGVDAVISGSYLGLTGVLLGLLLGTFCLKIATQRSEIYEQGFASKNIFGSQTARYADLKSVTRGAVRTNGVVTTTVQLTEQSGKRLTVSREALGQGDKESQLLLDRACMCMADNWARKIESSTEVVWLVKGGSPLLKIRKDGVLVEGGTNADGFIPLSQMRVQPKQVGLAVDILNGERKIVTVNSGDPNYYVGLALIAKILEKQTHAFAAGAHS